VVPPLWDKDKRGGSDNLTSDDVARNWFVYIFVSMDVVFGNERTLLYQLGSSSDGVASEGKVSKAHVIRIPFVHRVWIDRVGSGSVWISWIDRACT